MGLLSDIFVSKPLKNEDKIPVKEVEPQIRFPRKKVTVVWNDSTHPTEVYDHILDFTFGTNFHIIQLENKRVFVSVRHALRIDLEWMKDD